MKEFNLKLAKAGHPVQTRDGRKARIICWDRIDVKDTYPIIALVTDMEKEEIHSYTLKGRFRDSGEEELDLVMVPEKLEGWVNVYRENITKDVMLCPVCFHSRESAESHIGWKEHTYIKTIKIEWEE